MPKPAPVAVPVRRDPLDRVYEVLDRHAPAKLVAAMQALRRPSRRRLRLPLGLFFILCSFFWFLPIVGVEFLPLGLLLLAEDVPILRKPVGRFVLRLELAYLRTLRWWRGGGRTLRPA